MLLGSDQRKVLNGLQRNFIGYSNLLHEKKTVRLSFDDCSKFGIEPHLITRSDESGNQFCFEFRVEYLPTNRIKGSR